MLLLRNLTLARGGRPLVEGASLQVHAGHKIGVVGANGCGKSSLFSLLRGELHAETGDLELPPNWVIAHVAQDVPALPDPALELVLDGDNELRRIERALADTGAAHAGEHIADLHARYSEIGGYAARARAAELLHGLGFVDADLGRPVADFSGGWRARLNLARALMCRSDLLLLDEPTNHLDLDAVFWLESWIRAYPGTLLMVSHDRDFLDATVGHILSFEGGRLVLYKGGYSAFEQRRAERLAVQQALYEKQQREIAHLHGFIDRFQAKATKARQAQSRIKALARMEAVAAAHVDTPFTFRIPAPTAVSDPLLQLAEADLGYAGHPILTGVSLSLRPGDRLGLLGHNGAGKSTLVKCLAGLIEPLAGRRVEGRNLRIGYFAQHHLEQLRADESPLQQLIRQDPKASEQSLRDYLGTFDFHGDEATGPCGRFSGGEKARLALALLIHQRPNLLLLDEPTNHLDLEMREALTLALQEYEGAVLLVSHDRHLLRTTVDAFRLVADGRVMPYNGDLDDYAAWLAARRRQAAQAESAPDKAARREARLNEKAERQARLTRRRPLIKEVEALERDLAAWSEELAGLETRLADPALYDGGATAELASLARRRADLAERLPQAETRWLEAQAQLEALDDD